MELSRLPDCICKPFRVCDSCIPVVSSITQNSTWEEVQKVFAENFHGHALESALSFSKFNLLSKAVRVCNLTIVKNIVAIEGKEILDTSNCRQFSLFNDVIACEGQLERYKIAHTLIALGANVHEKYQRISIANHVQNKCCAEVLYLVLKNGAYPSKDPLDKYFPERAKTLEAASKGDNFVQILVACMFRRSDSDLQLLPMDVVRTIGKLFLDNTLFYQRPPIPRYVPANKS